MSVTATATRTRAADLRASLLRAAETLYGVGWVNEAGNLQNVAQGIKMLIECEILDDDLDEGRRARERGNHA